MQGLPKPSKNLKRVLMPSDFLKDENPKNQKEEEADPDTIAALVAHINDDVEDASILRSWRKPVALALMVVAGLFYILFFTLLVGLIFSESLRLAVSDSMNFYIVLVLVLTVIPTILLGHVAKAIFTRKGTIGDAPYTPIQAILHLLKEIKGQ